MKEKQLEILQKVSKGELTPNDAHLQLLGLSIVSNSLLDLDGKTIPVTFHVSKYKHKIEIDLEQ